jgi:hypothetical protein
LRSFSPAYIGTVFAILASFYGFSLPARILKSSAAILEDEKIIPQEKHQFSTKTSEKS